MRESASWVVNHAVGRLNLGTLVIVPRDHVVMISDLDEPCAAELGVLIRDTARVVETICRPEQTYVCMWSHGRSERKHLHILVQPVTSALVAQYGGLRGEQLQAKMLTTGELLAPEEVERFCVDARRHFST